jgi:serine/threonine protein kinase
MAARYELVGPLGTGGMAEVLLARRVGPNGFERLLAVKRIRPERAHDPDLVRMLLDEARNAASLVHQRIVQVFDIEMRDGAVELAMEYLHGKTLEDVLAREPKLPLAAAIAIAIAVAEGLHHAHTRAIVHRDVAPSNVMITYDGSVKLIDFGIAKSANNISNTVYGTFKGRLGYSSPEQCRCESADARSDLYSLAVLLYEMTTGARAFTGATEQDLLARMTEARIAPPSSIDPQFPRALEGILLNNLAPDRAQRSATAQDLQIALEAFARANGLNLSEASLAKLMGSLFTEELQTWTRAKSTGMTLDDHVLSQVVRNTTPTLGELETRVLPPRVKRAPNRAWLLPAVVVVLLATAFMVTRLLLTG